MGSQEPYWSDMHSPITKIGLLRFFKGLLIFIFFLFYVWLLYNGVFFIVLSLGAFFLIAFKSIELHPS